MNESISREQAMQLEAKNLDISPSKYKQAMERFKSMQDNLSDEQDGTNSSDIYLQGSFKLGTEIRPYKDSKDADYDIDIVCCLGVQKENTTPDTVKHQIGKRLKECYKNMLDEEGKRCWTVKYAIENDIGFHIDIVPSVPEPTDNDAIAITNKCNSTGKHEWSTSNPKGFAAWFRNKNKRAFESAKQSQKRVILEAYTQDKLFNREEDVPNIHVKTSLQRTIQLLKRHRDIRFSGQPNEKCKPISMIITVLAAQIYQGEDTIYKTLHALIKKLSAHAAQIQDNFQFNEVTANSTYKYIKRINNEKWFIPNPTNPQENFADKWHETENGVPHARAKAFFKWVQWAHDDFINEEVLNGNSSHLSVLLSGKSDAPAAVTKPKVSMFDVPHRDSPPWQLPLNYTVEISGHFKAKNAQWQKFNPDDLLDKGYDLQFLARTIAPKPFDVYWQVVNTGQDAERANGLRGDIFKAKIAGSGGLKRDEFTGYTGRHWIQCFIIKDGVCVAYSDEFIVRIV